MPHANEFFCRAAERFIQGIATAVVALLTALPATGEPYLKYPLVLGIDEQATQAMYAPLIEQTVVRLKEKLGESGLVVRILPLGKLREEVRSNKVDFFLASSSFFRQMARLGAQDLATAQTVKAIDPNMSQGALIAVRGDRFELRSVKSLAGKRLAGLKSEETTVYDMVAAELLALKVNEKEIPPVTAYSTVEELLNAVKTNEADALVLPSCYLEWYIESKAIDTSWMRVISPRQNAALLCAYSTRLYPNLTIASLPKMPSFLARSITQTLLAVDSSGNNEYFWGIATNFRSVDLMLRSLNKDAWASDRQWTLTGFIRQHLPVVVAILVVLITLSAHSLIVGALVRRRTTQLTNALIEQTRLQAEARKANARVEKMQRIGILGQLSALFAHELGQPLNNISLYAFSLRRQLNKGKADAAKIQTALKEIEGQSARAGEIIRKIREAVRSHTGKNECAELSTVVQKAIANFELTQQFQGAIHFKSNENLLVRADPVEIELMIINLLRNAAQAQTSKKRSAIFVTVTHENNSAILSISDLGPTVSDEMISKLTTEHRSSKPEGLGLGLSIVRNLVEMLGGRIRFAKSTHGGLEVSLSIPLIKEPVNA